MESYGLPGRIQVTEATCRLLKGHCRFESRGEVEIKGKGCMPTYFILSGEEALPESLLSLWADASENHFNPFASEQSMLRDRSSLTLRVSTAAGGLGSR
jgi:hypothetical protein